MASTFVLIELEMTLMVSTPMVPESVPRIELYLTLIEITYLMFQGLHYRKPLSPPKESLSGFAIGSLSGFTLGTLSHSLFTQLILLLFRACYSLAL